MVQTCKLKAENVTFRNKALITRYPPVLVSVTLMVVSQQTKIQQNVLCKKKKKLPEESKTRKFSSICSKMEAFTASQKHKLTFILEQLHRAEAIWTKNKLTNVQNNFNFSQLAKSYELDLARWRLFNAAPL